MLSDARKKREEHIHVDRDRYRSGSGAKQWEARPGDKLNVPPEITGAISRKAICEINGHVSVAWCRQVIIGPGYIELRGALLDTSDRAVGILTTKRLTYREKITMVNIPVQVLEVAPGEVKFDA